MQGIWLVVFVFQWIITLGLATLTIGILRYLSLLQNVVGNWSWANVSFHAD